MPLRSAGCATEVMSTRPGESTLTLPCLGEIPHKKTSLRLRVRTVQVSGRVRPAAKEGTFLGLAGRGRSAVPTPSGISVVSRTHFSASLPAISI